MILAAVLLLLCALMLPIFVSWAKRLIIRAIEQDMAQFERVLRCQVCSRYWTLGAYETRPAHRCPGEDE